jgi:hypothetical protein
VASEFPDTSPSWWWSSLHVVLGSTPEMGNGVRSLFEESVVMGGFLLCQRWSDGG